MGRPRVWMGIDEFNNWRDNHFATLQSTVSYMKGRQDVVVKLAVGILAAQIGLIGVIIVALVV